MLGRLSCTSACSMSLMYSLCLKRRREPSKGSAELEVPLQALPFSTTIGTTSALSRARFRVCVSCAPEGGVFLAAI